MWADLNLEAVAIKHELDDDWFNTSHLFHQCSSRQLKCAFSHLASGNLESNFDLESSLSSKLPASVSRLRGGRYKSINTEKSQHEFPLHKRISVKILVGKKLAFDSKPNKEREPNSRSVNSKGAHPETHFNGSCLSRVVSANRLKLVSNFRDVRATSSSSKIPSSFSDIPSSEDNSGSTISYESSHNHNEKVLETKDDSADNSNKLLSNLRVSMRKSYVTRKAWRVEAKNQCLEQLKVHKSSSVKSFACPPSTSGHTHYTLKGTTVNDRNSSNSFPLRTHQIFKNRLKSGNGSMSFHVSIDEKVIRLTKGHTMSGEQFMHHGVKKSKVIQQNFVRKALFPIKMKEVSRNVSAAKPNLPSCSIKKNEVCSDWVFPDKVSRLPIPRLMKKGTSHKGRKCALATTIEASHGLWPMAQSCCDVLQPASHVARPPA